MKLAFLILASFKGTYVTLLFCIDVIHCLKALLMLKSDIALFMTLRLPLCRYARIIVLYMQQ